MVNKIITGPSVEVGEIQYPIPALLDEIEQARVDDDTAPEEVDERMMEVYAKADINGRLLIDRFMVEYCGVSIKTLLAEEGTDELLAALEIDRAESDQDGD